MIRQLERRGFFALAAVLVARRAFGQIGVNSGTMFDIEMHNLAFGPAGITAMLNDSIRWTNLILRRTPPLPSMAAGPARP